MKKYILLLLASVACQLLRAQNVGVGTTSPDSSAMFDIYSNSKGLLIPRMNSLQRTGITAPAQGLLVYDTDTNTFWFYNASSWTNLSVSLANGSWLLSGNSSTNPSSHFLGTTDNQPLRLRLNNRWAGELNVTTQNYFIGDSSGAFNTHGVKNTALGSYASYKNTYGYWNVAVGAEALYSNTTGTENVAIGSGALYTNTTGMRNVAVGVLALRANSIAAFNTAIGYSALNKNTGYENTGTGAFALLNNTTGNFNTANGFYSLMQNITGSYNTAIGYKSLNLHKENSYNTAIGSFALYSDTIGTYNTSVGYASLYSNQSGIRNTAVGHGALYNNNNGTSNTAIGYGALAGTTESYYNVAVGDSAMYHTTGGANTAIGTRSLTHLIAGAGNISIGYNSGTAFGSPNVHNTISIGNGGMLNGASNQAFIGNLSTTWNGGNVPWSTYSDARLKANISEDVKGLDFIIRLRPVTYSRSIKAMTRITGNNENEEYEGKYDIEKIMFSGFLAQEVEQAAKDASYNFGGITAPQKATELYTLSYEQFVVPLVKAVQEQQSIIQKQQQRIDDLEKKFAALEKLLVSKQ